MSTATVDLLHPLQRALDRVSCALDEVGDPALWSLTDREVDALPIRSGALVVARLVGRPGRGGGGGAGGGVGEVVSSVMALLGVRERRSWQVRAMPGRMSWV